MQFEENPSPYVTFVEQSATPDPPSAGRQKIFPASADHKFKRVDAAGNVVDIEAMQDVLDAVPSGVVNGKLIFVNDGGTPASILAYYGVGGVWAGPFPLFELPS